MYDNSRDLVIIVIDKMRIGFGDTTINIVIISMTFFKLKIGMFIIVIFKII